MILVFILSLFTTLVLAIVLFLNTAPQCGGRPSAAQKRRYAASAHYANGQFSNLVETSLRHPEMSFLQTLRHAFNADADRISQQPLPFTKVKESIFAVIDRETVQITWLGHSTVLMQFEGHTLLTDPMFGDRASPVSFMGPKRFNAELPLAPSDVPHLDAILLSHDHYDHLDRGSIRALHDRTEAFFVPLGIAPHLIRWGVSPGKIHELDWWETARLDDIKFIAAPARHFSGRRFTDRANTLWASWVVRSKKHCLYYGGDSGFGPHFKEIGEKYGPFDLTLLENGAYSDAWPFVHMTPEQTVQAHLDLRGRALLPIHWAQFPLSQHAWYEPIERLLAAGKGLTIVTPQMGERFVVGQEAPAETWWRDLLCIPKVKREM
ncbi:MBL fold metallo-hydrolase [candidate division KSB1 bacterium]|nr:MBL fold metallo-hydrolase [candidate division KSB1 bacterium]